VAEDLPYVPRLAAVDVTVNFGGLRALADVNLAVADHQVAGLIGPNGAGKTTLFNVITGVQQAVAGRVMLDGEDITGWPPHRRGRAGIARTFQRLALYTGLTVHDNLLSTWEAATPGGVLGRGRGQGRRRVEEVMDQLGLGDIADRLAGQLSTGLGRMVELGRALCASPRVLLLDEPSAGLDPDETAEFSRIIRGVATEGDAPPAVLLVEHDVALVMEVCDHITVLDFGETIAEGEPAAIRANPAVVAAYLGEAS
jgi:branched-chain amino acid transport system ATP-binding protein